jgi:hypothetical protein
LEDATTRLKKLKNMLLRASGVPLSNLRGIARGTGTSFPPKNILNAHFLAYNLRSRMFLNDMFIRLAGAKVQVVGRSATIVNVMHAMQLAHTSSHSLEGETMTKAFLMSSPSHHQLID